MQESFELVAEVRTDLGKGASRRLRFTDKVPAVLYGGKADPVSLTLDHKDLAQHLESEAFYSHVLSVKVGGKAEKAILRDVQRHPSKPIIMHIDLLRVDDNTTLHMSVPVHFINESDCVGVKVSGGSITHVMSQVGISCLAKNIPEFIEIDVEKIDIGESIHLSEIILPNGVKLVELAHGHDLAIVSVIKQRGVTEDDDMPATPAADGEATPDAESGGES